MSIGNGDSSAELSALVSTFCEVIVGLSSRLLSDPAMGLSIWLADGAVEGLPDEITKSSFSVEGAVQPTVRST